MCTTTHQFSRWRLHRYGCFPFLTLDPHYAPHIILYPYHVPHIISCLSITLLMGKSQVARELIREAKCRWLAEGPLGAECADDCTAIVLFLEPVVEGAFAGSCMKGGAGWLASGAAAVKKGIRSIGFS